MGVTLFWRNANRIDLTPQGKFFLSSAQDMVNNYGKAIAELRDFSNDVHQNLKVGYFSSFEEKLLQNALYKMRENDPKIHLTVSEQSNEHLIQSILTSNLDAGLSINYGHIPTEDNPELSSKIIFSGEMVMGDSTLNPLSRQKYLVPDDILTDKPILYYSPESSTFLLESFLASMPFINTYERIERVTSVEQMHLLVALDQAFAFYPAGLLDDSLLTSQTSHIKFLPVKQTATQKYEIIVLYRRDNQNPALKNFLKLI